MVRQPRHLFRYCSLLSLLLLQFYFYRLSAHLVNNIRSLDEKSYPYRKSSPLPSTCDIGSVSGASANQGDRLVDNSLMFDYDVVAVNKVNPAVGTSTVVSSIFNLAKTILGAGVLSLPFGKLTLLSGSTYYLFCYSRKGLHRSLISLQPFLLHRFYWY